MLAGGGCEQQVEMRGAGKKREKKILSKVVIYSLVQVCEKLSIATLENTAESMFFY